MGSKTRNLICAALGAGALTLGLRLQLYRVGFDHKHILSSSHPLHLICLALAGIMAVALAFAVRKLGGSSHPRRNFPAHPLRSLSLMAAGCLMGAHGATLFREAEATLAYIRAALSLAAAGSMILGVLVPRRKLGLQGLFHGIITLFFALDLLCRYRNWSGNPQLPDYVLQIFSCLLLSLCSYHRLAFDAGLGKRRSLLWCSLMALYLSFACVSGPETETFYLGGAFWAASCICTGKPPVNFLPDGASEEAV